MLKELLSLFIAGYLVDIRVNRIQSPELLQELLGRLRANRVHPRHIVGAITNHGLKVDDLIRSDRPNVHQLLGGEEFVFSKIEHRDPRSDQLTTILVARYQ